MPPAFVLFRCNTTAPILTLETRRMRRKLERTRRGTLWRDRCRNRSAFDPGSRLLSFLAAIAACSSLGSTFGLAAGVDGPDDEGRNIVFILTDDQRFDALGLLNDYFRTPNLDRLAEAGVLFENAFVTTSLCSPSRASILSGQYAHAHQVLDNSTRMPQDIPTFAQGLQAAGYETAFVGKWHMGGASDDPRPGFDHWVSFRGQGPYTNPTLNINGTRAETPRLHDGPADRPRGSSSSGATHDRPFLLYLSHKAVTRAVHPGRAPCRRLRRYALFASAVDGRHRRQLRRQAGLGARAAR